MNMFTVDADMIWSLRKFIPTINDITYEEIYARNCRFLWLSAAIPLVNLSG